MFQTRYAARIRMETFVAFTHAHIRTLIVGRFDRRQIWVVDAHAVDTADATA